MLISELENNLKMIKNKYGDISVIFKPYNSYYVENIVEANVQNIYIGDDETTMKCLVLESTRQIGSME
jgi:hypothetical protein